MIGQGGHARSESNGAPVVRPARRGDARALLAVDQVTHASRNSPGPAPTSDHHVGLDGVDDVQVVEVDGVVRGYVVLGPAHALESSRHVQMLRGLAVDPVVQGRGLGRVLLRAAIAEARRRDATRVILRVLGPNLEARRLYESEGFVVEGVLVGQFVLDGHEVDDVLMARRLDVDGPVPQ